MKAKLLLIATDQFVALSAATVHAEFIDHVCGDEERKLQYESQTSITAITRFETFAIKMQKFQNSFWISMLFIRTENA